MTRDGPPLCMTSSPEYPEGPSTCVCVDRNDPDEKAHEMESVSEKVKMQGILVSLWWRKSHFLLCSWERKERRAVMQEDG